MGHRSASGGRVSSFRNVKIGAVAINIVAVNLDLALGRGGFLEALRERVDAHRGGVILLLGDEVFGCAQGFQVQVGVEARRPGDPLARVFDALCAEFAELRQLLPTFGAKGE